MQIVYLGHSAFKLKGKGGMVVTDPYSNESTGFRFPRVTADLITVSHDHADHNSVQNVSPVASREKVFVVSQAGEYEVSGISVFGIPTQHDDSNGSQRGKNIIFTILLDDLRICHLGDLGHELSAKQVDAIGSVDVLLCPVGGSYSLDASQAIKTIRQLEPSIVIPMHYKTPQHTSEAFLKLDGVETFLQAYGVEVQPVASLEVSSLRLPEETEIAVLVPTIG